jgi:uncharacterized damage-inducible protein DinB
MSKIARIVDELTRALEHDPWYGPSIHDVIADMSADEAAAHPVRGAHSVWELVHHVTAWLRAGQVRVKGNVCELQGDTDWPPVRETSDQAWAAARDDLQRAQSELVATLRTLDDSKLRSITPNRDYDLEHLLNGLVQHHAYHTGQMTLIKNASRRRG